MHGLQGLGRLYVEVEDGEMIADGGVDGVAGVDL